ncbi:hypothetical protein P4646_15510 [Peribacillus simplex]|uniref:hypothetical protein n=1 Tax=Peribacillus simplex TaxID=1478 RepID=UPI002E23DFA5|nr:hypothetical protein [Peribacillus simplex]MED4093801.1 hypothetical protein [Peribacillus simplex]
MEGSFLSKSIKVVVFLAEDGEYALPIESVFPSKKPDALLSWVSCNQVNQLSGMMVKCGMQ